MKRFLLLALLPLAACGAITKDLGAVGQQPGMYFCAGEGTISVVGQVAIYGGNGAVTFKCGQGAYFGGARPVGPLPTLQQPSQTPQIPNFPPIQ